MEFKLKTLTPIWTGGVEGKCDRLHETGIIGSLRWWYEALVRGLGGYACDPTSERKDERCDLNQEKFHKAIKDGKNIQEALNEQICPVCQLFGCTGWGRKIKIIMNHPEIQNIDIGFKGEFTIKFKELKKLTDEEKWLLNETLYIIDRYGTIGARCTLKPSDKPYYRDYGIVRAEGKPDVGKLESHFSKEQLKNYLARQREKFEKQGRAMPSEWPDLRYFIFAPDNGLDPNEYKQLQRLEPEFLDGEKGKANKFASFKLKKRFWGYTKADEYVFNRVCKELKKKGLELKYGKEVIENEF